MGFPTHSAVLITGSCTPKYCYFSSASSAFARRYSQNLVWFLFLSLLRCFSSGGSPFIPILFSMKYMILHHMCSHIRKSADQCLFAAPRSLSQLVTSFFGSWCQGIHHMLFIAWTSSVLLLIALSFVHIIVWIVKELCEKAFLSFCSSSFTTLVAKLQFH